MIKSLVLAVAVISHASGYYTSIANHLRRWLEAEGIAAEVTGVDKMAPTLAKERLAFLVGFDAPTAAEIKMLRTFNSRGGKLVVFHSASPALAALMGVKPLGYRAAAYPGEWSRMDFQGRSPEGLPASIRQTSTVLQRAVPVAGQGRILATWADRNGRSSGEAAWIATRGGFWMTHVLLADGDEALKAQLVGALVGAVEPAQWNLAAHRQRVEARRRAISAYALRQRPQPGEIHAVWDHSGAGLYPGDWARTFRVLTDSKVTDLFVNVGGAGFARYRSSVLPGSKMLSEDGDQLAACLKAAAQTGIRVHAWLCAFTATCATPERMEEFRRRGWRLRLKSGALSEYLDPANPAVQEYVLAAVSELAECYPVAGVHLDFVRWGENTVKGGEPAAALTRFVTAARRRVKRPKMLSAAVYGSYPSCIAAVGQDWHGWLDANLIDYAVPMNYTESSVKFAALVAAQSLKRSHARRILAGIGVTANESRLNARQVIDQAKCARYAGLAGVALFDLDVTLEKDVLPFLRLGLWKK